MLFNSYIFILLFLPLVCAGYYFLIRIKKQNWINLFLLVMSLGFYAYGDKTGLLLILANILINYLFYKEIEKNQNNTMKKRILLESSITVDLLILFYFKYMNFFITNVNFFLGKEYTIMEIIQPLGISFIIFQQIAFLVDVSRGEVETCNLIEYSLFIFYFPHVSSGPILLHKDIMSDLKGERKVDWHKISTGIYMFVMGLGKKVLIQVTVNSMP